MPINTATATEKDLEAIDTSELLALYNKITGEGIKKFADRKTAIRRTMKVIGQLGPGENVNEEDQKGTPTETQFDKNSKRASYESRIIILLVKENPKRKDSRAHKKFGILMEHDGKSIRDYKDKEGKYPTLDIEKGWPATELRWGVRLGLVKIAVA